jgi:hypothetical protein
VRVTLIAVAASTIAAVIAALAFDRAVFRVDIDLEHPANGRDGDVEADGAQTGDPLRHLALETVDAAPDQRIEHASLPIGFAGPTRRTSREDS